MKRLRSIRAEAGWHGTGIVPDRAMRCKAARTGFTMVRRRIIHGQPIPFFFRLNVLDLDPSPALVEILKTALDLQIR